MAWHYKRYALYCQVRPLHGRFIKLCFSSPRSPHPPSPDLKAPVYVVENPSWMRVFPGRGRQYFPAPLFRSQLVLMVFQIFFHFLSSSTSSLPLRSYLWNFYVIGFFPPREKRAITASAIPFHEPRTLSLPLSLLPLSQWTLHDFFAAFSFAVIVFRRSSAIGALKRCHKGWRFFSDIAVAPLPSAREKIMLQLPSHKRGFILVT